MRNYQQSEFQDAYKILSSKIGNNQKLGSNIACLNPFLDSDGLIRVGGRLKQSSLEWSVVHPILLPRKGSITKLIVKWCREKAAHSGRNITLNEVRSSRYWVLQGNSLVKQIISKCVTCRRLRGRVGEQLMADLPSDRFQEEPPFTHCGHVWFIPHKGTTKHLEALWGAFHMFSEPCCPYRNDKDYGHRFFHPCSQMFHSQKGQC